MSSEHVDKLLAVASEQLKAARDAFAQDRRIRTDFPYARWYIGAFLEWAAVVTEALRVVGDDPASALRASSDVDAGTGDVRDRNGATFADHWSAIGTRSATAGDTTKWPFVYYRGSGTDVATDLRAIMPREKLQAMVDALRASGDVDQGTGPDLAEQLRWAGERWLRIQPLIRALHTWESEPGGEWQLARAFEDWQREEAAALDDDGAADPSGHGTKPDAVTEPGRARSSIDDATQFAGPIAAMSDALSSKLGASAVLLVVLRTEAADAWPILKEGPIAVHSQRGPVRVRLEGQRELEDARLNDRIATLSAELDKTRDRESEVREQLATARREYELARLAITERDRRVEAGSVVLAATRDHLDRVVSAALRLLPLGTDPSTDSLVKALDTLSDEHQANIRALLHVEQTLADLRRGPVRP